MCYKSTVNTMQISPHERDERVQIMNSFKEMHENVMEHLDELIKEKSA
jgi:hypothetical protein